MSDKRYVVPEGMLKAACLVGPCRAYGSSSPTPPDEIQGLISDMAVADKREKVLPILEAAIRWQSENPPKASMKQLQEMYDKVDQGNGGTYIPSYLEEWVRRMYLAPEPEEPEALKDLLVSPFGDYGSKLQLDICKADCARQNAKLIEAYERGKAGK